MESKQRRNFAVLSRAHRRPSRRDTRQRLKREKKKRKERKFGKTFAEFQTLYIYFALAIYPFPVVESRFRFDGKRIQRSRDAICDSKTLLLQDPFALLFHRG